MSYMVLACIIVILILPLYMYLEAGMVKVNRIKLDKGTDFLKVVHLSDIHIGTLHVPLQKVKRIISEEAPDLLILTGDYIEKPSHLKKFYNFLSIIDGDFKKVLCFGNHDFEALENNSKYIKDFIENLQSRGFKPLINSSHAFEFKGKTINIYGLADIRSEYYKPEIITRLKNKESDVNIIITHNPDAVLDMAYGSADYFLSGHFHGGQFWAPFNFEFRVLRHEKLGRMKITRGFHNINGIKVYINRGLGTVLFPMRFLSRPEIAVLYIPMK